jgi:hypothetical protein
MKRGRKQGQLTTLESWAINNLASGKVFYTNKQDKDITAIASHYGVKVRTERFVILHPVTLEADRITKVTII